MARKRQMKKYERQMAEQKTEISLCLQYQNRETGIEELTERIREIWRTEGGQEDPEKIEVYLTPEDGLAYFVINGTYQGQVEL